jgi:DNA-binding NtrC family response regulator
LFLPDSSFDILIIDDEPGLLNLARIYLEMEEGLRITTASSGSQAMELITSCHMRQKSINDPDH